MTQGIYQIEVRGHLDSSRLEWFEGWAITQKEKGTTVLTDQATDQSDLHGMIVKIRNLNLPIIAINYL